jgi:hypothetical protein
MRTFRVNKGDEPIQVRVGERGLAALPAEVDESQGVQRQGAD